MPLGFEALHPVGMDENSPAFQRWDRSQTYPSPGGTADVTAFQASLRDASAPTPIPSVETLGYCRMSLRDRAAGRVSQILVTLLEDVRAPVYRDLPFGLWNLGFGFVIRHSSFGFCPSLTRSPLTVSVLFPGRAQWTTRTH